MALPLAFLTKLVQGLTIIMLAILIPFSLSLTEQGAFFLIVSFSSLFVFVELGLSNVLIIYYSKNWGEPNSPNAQKVAKIYTESTAWFCIGGIVLACFILLQYTMMSINQPILLRNDIFIASSIFVILFIIEIIIVPRFLFISGVHSIVPLYLARFLKVFFEFFILTIFFLFFGFSFFAFPIYLLSSLICSICIIYLNRNQLDLLRRTKPLISKKLLWFSEIWKVQWRFSLGWMFGYFTFAIFTPLAFWLAGPETAGRIGFTFVILNGLMGLANVITVSKVPELAMLAKNFSLEEMDILLKRLLGQSSFIYIFGSITVVGSYIGVENFFPYHKEFLERIVGLNELLIFMAGGYAMILTTPITYYVYSFLEMPFLPVSIMTGISTVLFSSIGFYINNLLFVAIGYTLSYVLIALPINYLIFSRKKRELKLLSL